MMWKRRLETPALRSGELRAYQAGREQKNGYPHKCNADVRRSRAQPTQTRMPGEAQGTRLIWGCDVNSRVI